jgi:methyl-accepting chemotaxis protein
MDLRMIRVPIGWKITAVVALAYFALALTSIITIRVRFGDKLDKEFESKAVAIAQALAASSEEKLVAGNVEGMQSFVDGFKTVHGVSYVYIQDPAGDVLVHTFKVRIPAGITSRNPVQKDDKYRTASFSDPALGDVREVAVPILFGSVGTVHVGMDEGLVHAELSSLTWVLIFQFAVVFLLGIVLLHVAVRFILFPLGAVLAALRRTGEGDLARPIRIGSADEFGDLGREAEAARVRLAGMIARVQQAYGAIQSANAQVARVYSEVAAGSGRQAALASDAMGAVEQTRKLAGEVTEGTHQLEKSTSTSVSAVMELGASIEEVSGQAQNLYRSVGETKRAMEGLSSSIEEISRNLASLSKASDETASSMSEMGASVEQVRVHADTTSRDAASMTETADAGVRASKAAIEGMNAIRESSTLVTGLISTLSKRIEEIDGILRFITDITGKTNLLALNAAIIAAQAGAQGKGFGVVADEINELAQNTNAQTKKIAAVIEGIRQEVKRTDKAIRDSNFRVEEGTRLTGQTAEALEKIRENTDLVSMRVSEIARTTAEQALTGKRVMVTTENLAVSVGNIREAGVRQSESGQRILHLAREVEAVADKLKNSTVEETETSRLINADLVRITQVVGEIARAMEDQGKGAQTAYDHARDLTGIIESNRKSVVGLQEVFAVLEEKMGSLRKELEMFSVGDPTAGGAR